MIVGAILFAAAVPDPVAGTWEGSSLCQVKPSPCNDEHVVYRVTGTGPRHYKFDAFKLIGGKELFMGTIDLTYDPARHSLDGSIWGQRGTATVHFSLMGNHLSGSMTLDGKLYRLIEVDKR